jgi:hypothetical protein
VRALARAAGALGLALAVAGCGGGERQPPCPKIFIASETSVLTRFREGPGRDLTDVAFEAELLGYSGSCRYDKNVLNLEINVDFAETRGPAGEGRRAKFEYFVAIPRLFPDPAGKRVFDVDAELPANQRRIQFRDEIQLDIPVAKPSEGPANEIYIGLQLTPEDLEFNRRRRTR